MNPTNNNNINMNTDKTATLNWILEHNRTPYPYSPQNAALKGMEPKQPGYFDGNYFKQLKWKDYQDFGSLEKDFQDKLIKLWHGDERVEGIGCNAGFNGEFYFSMVDFDLKNFDSPEAMNQAIEGWENRNPGMSLCPRVRTQSGGYRYFIGFESVPKNWTNTISFSFTQGGEKSLGELMVGPGGLGIILGKGLKGDYSWDRNACGDIPVFQSPESIGLFEVVKIQKSFNSIYDNVNTTEEAREALSFIPVSQFDNDYKGWIDLGMACHAAGLDFEDWDNWSRGSKEYSNNKETFNHWKSFKDGGGITAATLFKAAKDNGYKPTKTYQQTQSKPSLKTSGTAALKPEAQSNVVPLHSKKSTESLPPIKDEINKLFDKNLTQSELENAIQEIAQIYNRQPNNVWRLYHKQSNEYEQQSDKNEQKANLDKLLRLSQKTLDLSDYLHPNLATPLKNIAQWMGTSQEAILTTLLPVAASLIHLDTQLELIKALNFYANPIIYSGIVAESGSLKSPTQKLLTNPLMSLQEIADKDYESLMQDYQEDLDFYKDSLKDKNNPPLPVPSPPKRREYFVVDVTSEAVAGVQADQPDRGFLGFQDELKALISSQNAYRGGRGSDAEKLLSGRDGSGIKVNRAGGKRLFCKRSGYSITGGIQPDILKQLMGSFDDPNGFWARFIWCILPVTPSRYPENATAYDVNNLLLDVYKKLENAAPQIHKMSPEAKAIYKAWYNQLDDLKLKEIRQGLRAVYSKMKGVTGEFALILHRLNAAIDGCQPDEYISKDAMTKAIKLAKFYITQIKLIHADGAVEEGQLDAVLQAIVKQARLKPQEWLPANKFKESCFRRSKTKIENDDIRGYFLKLVEFGYGAVSGSGKSLKFCIEPGKNDNLSSFGETSKSIDSIGLEDFTQELKNDKNDKNDKKMTDCHEPQTHTVRDIQPLGEIKNDKMTTNNDTSQKPLDVPSQEMTNDTDILESCHFCYETTSNPVVDGHDTLSSSVIFPSSSVISGERSPEPQPEPIPPSEPEHLDFDQLKEGDILFDGNGQPHQIIGRTRQLWETHRKQYISRNDIQQGKYHRATVEDIIKLIKRTIKGKNKAQAQWLYSVYGGDVNSLMAKAIDSNDSLIEIYNFDDWE